MASSSSSPHHSTRKASKNYKNTTRIVFSSDHDHDQELSETKQQSRRSRKISADDNNDDVVYKYKECRRNHAISVGSHAVDGCREFTPGGGGQAALLCDACGCHRSFHRKEQVIKHGGVHPVDHAAPPPQPPAGAAVAIVGPTATTTLVPMGAAAAAAYPTLPFVVLHPLDYNSFTTSHIHDQHRPSSAGGSRHHDINYSNPQQHNEHELDHMEQKPNPIMKRKN